MEKSKIFLSYCQQYTQLKDLFKSLIEDIGFEPIVFDHGATNTPFEKQDELIGKSNGLIAILTPDHKNDDGTWRYSEAVSTEIAFAYKSNIPYQLFTINEVDLSKSQIYNTTTPVQLNVNFDNNQMQMDSNNIINLFKTLISFKSNIDNLSEIEEEIEVKAVIRREHLEYTQVFQDMKKMMSKVRISAIALKNFDSLSFSATLDWKKKNCDGILLKNDCLKFLLISPKNISSTENIDTNHNHENSHRFNVRFSPEIIVGTKMSYGYDRYYDNYYPTSKEELQEMIDDKVLTNKIMVKEGMVGQNMTIKVPTKCIVLRFVFPSNFKVKKYKLKAVYLEEDSERIEESERINEFVELRYDEFDKKVEIVAKIPNPVINYEYYLLYEPPSMNTHS